MDTSLYIHIPFCRARCSYCDFNTYAGLAGLIPGYIDALCLELRELGTAAEAVLQYKLPIGTVYFGGGTPSLLAAPLIGQVLDTVRDVFKLQSGAEISLEANPDSTDLKNLKRLPAAGVNRISLGVQSFDPVELQVLGRIHTAEQTSAAVSVIREAGFDNLSFDLIYGIPGQTTLSWQASLQQAVRLSPQHLSLYSLTVEEGTKLQEELAAGRLTEPDPDVMAEMYEQACSFLSVEGYEQYEISNWAKPGKTQGSSFFPLYASRHNLQYWRNEPYLGVGAGAAGFAGGFRTLTIAHPAAYIRAFQKPSQDVFPFSAAVVEREAISRQREIEDTLMMGLRLTGAGVNVNRFIERFSTSPQVLYKEEIDLLVSQGLLEQTADSLRLTVKGRLLGNQVFCKFISS
ncbi:MAG: radical SAM family heme chaperone HemW [Anaerolineales bacterium]|nr:radical SAM family heme chaperone HemW [Anaerolineales bacterium]